MLRSKSKLNLPSILSKLPDDIAGVVEDAFERIQPTIDRDPRDVDYLRRSFLKALDHALNNSLNFGIFLGVLMNDEEFISVNALRPEDIAPLKEEIRNLVAALEILTRKSERNGGNFTDFKM